MSDGQLKYLSKDGSVNAFDLSLGISCLKEKGLTYNALNNGYFKKISMKLKKKKLKYKCKRI